MTVHLFVTSMIRTLVPLAVGWVTALIVSLGITLPEEAWEGLTATIVVGVAAGYYALVRALERRWPGLGIFLGVATQPVYAGKGITEDEVRAALDRLAAGEPDVTPPPADYRPQHRA